MNGDLYQVQFRGEIDGGRSIDEVKQNLAALFKAPPEKIDRLFSGSLAVIKKDIDRATALKYQTAMKKAGAVSTVIQMKTADAKPSVSTVTKKPGSPKVISIENVRGKLAYSPILCNSLSGNASTFCLNRADTQEQTFSSIQLVSVFREQPDPDGPATDSMALFIDSSKRPYLVETGHIRFGGFPEVVGQNSIRSVQNFIRFIIDKNPDICIDYKTELFLADSQYIIIANQLDHLTGLGEALEK